MVKKKALVVSSVGRHFHKFRSYDIGVLVNAGYEVHFASNFNLNPALDFVETDLLVKHQIFFERNPLSISNIFAFYQMIRLLLSIKFDVVHCQTPVAGILTRIACFFCGVKNVIYTAHGFHFYRGSSAISWLVYFNIEKILSLLTKKIVTINLEDYQLAKTRMYASQTVYCPGVGVNIEKFNCRLVSLKLSLRSSLSLDDDDFLLIMVGELNNNKNQFMAFEAMGLMKDFKKIKLLVVGDGENFNCYQALIVEKGLEKNIRLLGHRNDVHDLMAAADVVLSTSRREGLPVNLLEGMAAGLPIIATNCRGNRDLVKDGFNGFLVEIDASKLLVDRVLDLYKNPALREYFSQNNSLEVKKYSEENVAKIMRGALLD